MKHSITFGELADAYNAYRELTRSASNENTRRRFFEFLGQDVRSENFINDEAMNKVRWLTGPHAKTMYAIWKAQHGDKQ